MFWTTMFRYTVSDASSLSVLTNFLFKKHLEEDETLIRVVHKHWFLGFKALVWPTVFFVIDLFVLYRIETRGMLIATAIVGVVILVWWIRNFLDYYLDAWIITDMGIIDLEWFGWFHRQSTRVLYSDLEGVKYEIKGIFGTILRYGTVTVEKISTGAAIDLSYVRNPRQVEMLILKNMETYLHSKNMKDAKQVQELLSALVTEHIQIKNMPKDDE